jgi:hypothetical protein
VSRIVILSAICRFFSSSRRVCCDGCRQTQSKNLSSIDHEPGRFQQTIREGPMKAGEIFGACHRSYRVLREWLKDSTGTVPSLDLESPSPGYQWRPEPGRACEYVLDFERIGRRALDRSDWKGRLKLFNVYFVRGAEYHRAVRLVGVAEGTFDYWYREVKRILGKEFLRAGLFPPSRYFQARTARRTSRKKPSFGAAPRPQKKEGKTKAARDSAQDSVRVLRA